MLQSLRPRSVFEVISGQLSGIGVSTDRYSVQTQIAVQCNCEFITFVCSLYIGMITSRWDNSGGAIEEDPQYR